LLLFPIWFQWLLMASFYGIYVGVMYGINVPNYTDSNGSSYECGRGNLTTQCNAAGWIDRSIMGRHMSVLPCGPQLIYFGLPLQ